jgi:hypothetical protein
MFTTGVFCAKYDSSKHPVDSDWCRALMKRVTQRLETPTFVRRILLIVPIDAPDSRKLKLVIREGEQHDVVQFVSDFFELYHLSMEMVHGMAAEVLKRLPAVATSVPVGLSGKRQVTVALVFVLNRDLFVSGLLLLLYVRSVGPLRCVITALTVGLLTLVCRRRWWLVSAWATTSPPWWKALPTSSRSRTT